MSENDFIDSTMKEYPGLLNRELEIDHNNPNKFCNRMMLTYYWIILCKRFLRMDRDRATSKLN